jgi:hypothetical protein
LLQELAEQVVDVRLVQGLVEDWLEERFEADLVVGQGVLFANRSAQLFFFLLIYFHKKILSLAFCKYSFVVCKYT